MFVRMLKLPEPERRRYDVSSLRVAIHAAAPCPVPVKQQMIEWWGPMLYEYYAGTEGNGFTSIDSHEWLAHPGSVGPPAQRAGPHPRRRRASELPPGEAGRRSTSRAARRSSITTHPRRRRARRARRAGPRSATSATSTREGYLYLTDRKANMIISGGVNIYPQETENVLVDASEGRGRRGVRRPERRLRRGGEGGRAAGRHGRRRARARARADRVLPAAQLARLKCPRIIDFEAELPRHPTGKLYKRLLRDRYWGNRDSRIV